MASCGIWNASPRRLIWYLISFIPSLLLCARIWRTLQLTSSTNIPGSRYSTSSQWWCLHILASLDSTSHIARWCNGVVRRWKNSAACLFQSLRQLSQIQWHAKRSPSQKPYCASGTSCNFTMLHSTGTTLKPWSSTWWIIWRSFIVKRMFSVNSAPHNLQRRSRKPWKSSWLCPNRKKRRVTTLRTIFLRLQSIVTSMKLECRSSQKLHNILSTNRISTLWRCISLTTSLTRSASLAMSEMHSMNSQRERCGSWISITTIKSSWGHIPDIRTKSPTQGVSLLSAESQRCTTMSWWWNTSNQSANQGNDENPTTRNLDPRWLCLVVCNGKRGATESHCLVF